MFYFWYGSIFCLDYRLLLKLHAVTLAAGFYAFCYHPMACQCCPKTLITKENNRFSFKATATLSCNCCRYNIDTNNFLELRLRYRCVNYLVELPMAKSKVHHFQICGTETYLFGIHKSETTIVCTAKPLSAIFDLHTKLGQIRSSVNIFNLLSTSSCFLKVFFYFTLRTAQCDTVNVAQYNNMIKRGHACDVTR